MTSKFMDVLCSEGILADGAIGTEIYNRGIFINRCFDELNLSNPDLIKQIHKDYLKSGARLAKTNTFTANRASLTQYGIGDKVEKINAAGVKLARKVVKHSAFVAGSVGPISTSTSKHVSTEEWHELYKEQISILAGSGADVILLETFTDIDEIEAAIKAAKEACSLPVIACVSIKRIDEDEYVGLTPKRAAKKLDKFGADVIGVNCADGPQGVFDSVKIMGEYTDKPLAALPNAGIPRMVQGRLLYMATPEYMGEYARRYAQIGVSLIGGCCGTTPSHIKEMKKFLASLKVGTRTQVSIEEDEKSIQEKGVPPKKREEKSGFAAVLEKKFAICVEIDPPIGINAQKAIEGAKFLKRIGIDAINIADGPRAIPRMSPIALAKIIKDEVGLEAVVHYCCRDRNVLGMQMDMLGAAALKLNNLLIITGDPPKMGAYPEATPVFDMDSIGLIRLVDRLNRGLDFSNMQLKEPASFLIGCGCNPGAVDIDLEVERYKMKVDAGAEFVFSQPVYDMNMLDRFLKRIESFKHIPFFVGILPLASLKNAEFLHHEVPGMQIPPDIMERIRAQDTKDGQGEVGIEVASEIFKQAKGMKSISGAYIFPPFGKYELVARVIR